MAYFAEHNPRTEYPLQIPSENGTNFAMDNIPVLAVSRRMSAASRLRERERLKMNTKFWLGNMKA
jgi:hypothetical protein